MTVRRRALLLLAASAGASSLAADYRDPIQIVLQWRNDALGTSDTHRISTILEQTAGRLYQFERHDISAGTINFFLMAQDTEPAIRHVIRLYNEGRFVPGLRIAVAENYNFLRTDWTYRPVFPPDLKTFNLLEPGHWPSD